MSATEERKALTRLSQAVRNLITGARPGTNLRLLPPPEEPPPAENERSPGPSVPTEQPPR